MLTAAIWPALDYSRVPYRLYHDAEIYARGEAERIMGTVLKELGEHPRQDGSAGPGRGADLEPPGQGALGIVTELRQ